jgi:hypothetical protein
MHALHETFRVVQVLLAEWPFMLRVSSHRFIVLFVLLASAGWGASARAGIVLSANSIAAPGIRLERVQADFRSTPDGKGIGLHVTAARAELPALGWRHVGLTLDGVLTRDERQRWLLDGALKLRGAPGAALANGTIRLVVDDAANTLEIDVGQGKAAAAVAMPIDQPSHAQITLKNLPAGWLQGLLGSVWEGRATAGQIDAELALDVLDKGIQTSGQFGLDGLGFDSATGTLAGQRLNASGRIGIDTTGNHAIVELDANLNGGELLLGPVYARLPAHPVQWSMEARSKGAAGIDLTRLRLMDPDALQLEGTMSFAADGAVSAMNLGSFQARFPAAYDRYGKTWLAGMGFKDMRTAGSVSGSLDLGTGGLRAFAFSTPGLDLVDGQGRLGVAGLHGGLDWSATGNRPATRLGWQALQVYRIPNGAAQANWHSEGGILALSRPLDIPVLDGRLSVRSLAIDPAAARGKRLETSLVLTQVDMAALCRALGWPEFGGTIGGAVPALRYVDDRIELDGGLSLNVFDGFVAMTRMSLQQPFGTSPVFEGDIALNRLDLGMLTGVFDFGNITGRMDGDIDGLRLASWNPVAFKAKLRANGGGRISQQAVNSLTTVGGGGIAAGLQGAVLKLFKTFGYRRIGLSCTLEGDRCSMGGLSDDKDSYTIVEGSGLPRLTVVGHQREVDWPTLVQRLKSATEGNAPVVR